MVIFHSYVKLPEGICCVTIFLRIFFEGWFIFNFHFLFFTDSFVICGHCEDGPCPVGSAVFCPGTLATKGSFWTRFWCFFGRDSVSVAVKFTVITVFWCFLFLLPSWFLEDVTLPARAMLPWWVAGSCEEPVSWPFFVSQLRFCRFTALRCGAKALSICTSLSHREVPRCRWKNRRVQRRRPDNLLKISKSQMLGKLPTFFIWFFMCTLPVHWDSRCLKDKVHDCTGGLGLVTLSVERYRFFEDRTLNLNDLLWFVVILLWFCCDFVVILLGPFTLW